MRRPARPLAIALAVCLLAMAVTAGAAPLTEIDGDHPLTSDSAIRAYETDGQVSANLSRLDIGLTVSKTAGAAGIDGTHVDVLRTYVCVDYREGIDRRLRFYLPSAYFAPREATLDSLTDGPGADVTPVQNHTATSFTITFDGPARACYVLDPLTGARSASKSWFERTLGNLTGFSLPSLSVSSGDWSYVNGSKLTGNTTYALDHADPTVQFDRDPTVAAETWVSVPACSDPSEQAVCRLDRGNQSLLMSTQSQPPDVRYRTGSRGPLSAAQSALNDALAAAEQAIQSIEDAIGGWL